MKILFSLFFSIAVATAYGQSDPGQEAAQQAVQNAQLAAQQATQDAQLAAAQLAQQTSQQATEQAMQANQQMVQAALNDQPPSYPWPRRHGRSDKPTFLPKSGGYSSPTLVTMKADVPKASIYYTTDGSMPTSNSRLYTGPVLLNSTTQIRAISQEPHYTASKVVSEKYVITNIKSSQPASTQVVK